MSPDGSNVAFYVVAWSWIGNDVTALIKNLYIIDMFPPHLNDTYISLIPKKNVLPFTF
jgi:hypothetical protein